MALNQQLDDNAADFRHLEEEQAVAEAKVKESLEAKEPKTAKAPLFSIKKVAVSKLQVILAFVFLFVILIVLFYLSQKSPIPIRYIGKDIPVAGPVPSGK